MGENSTNHVDSGRGGDPEAIGRCTECGEVYVVQRENGGLRPIGTSGACECGNDTFEPAFEEDADEDVLERL